MVDSPPVSPVPAIPPLAGLCTLEEALRPGMSVEECVTWLKRLHYVWRRLHESFTARITAEPLFELKTAFSHQGWICAEQAGALRTRVGELREPPLGLDAVPHPGLEWVLDEVRSAPDGATFCRGVYGVVLPALNTAIAKYLERTNRLADAPSVRLLRFAQFDVEQLLSFGTQACAALADTEVDQITGWCGALETALSAAGGISGRMTPVGAIPPRQFKIGRAHV